LYENLFDFYGYDIFVPVLGCSCFSILISPPPPPRSGRLPRDPVPSFHFFVPGFSAARAARSSCFGFCSQFRVCRRLFCRSDCFSHVMCRTPAEGSRFLLGLSITRQERSQVRAVFPPVWIPCHSYFFLPPLEFALGAAHFPARNPSLANCAFRFRSASC
jgi:hypothetical protein